MRARWLRARLRRFFFPPTIITNISDDMRLLSGVAYRARAGYHAT